MSACCTRLVQRPPATSKHTILIVEQSVHHVLRIADHAYVLEHGHIVMEGPGTELLKDERLKIAYLGL